MRWAQTRTARRRATSGAIPSVGSLISPRRQAVKHEGFRHCSGIVVAREVGGCRLNKDSFVNFRIVGLGTAKLAA
jgi:hypothetical protein